MIETPEGTDELLAVWHEAQRVVDALRLDAPGRAEAEDRLHDARNALYDRAQQLERLLADSDSND